MDTRAAAPVGPRTTALTSGETYAVTVRGSNGQCTIPASATALSLNITIDNPTTSSYLTVFPADVDRPLASSLNWVARQAPTPNAVTSLIGGDDRIGLFNFNGTVDVIVDIVGYYELAPSSAGATGPAGPAGPVGAAGPQGPVGAPGAIGNQGSVGAAGVAGAVGPVGDIGLKGPTGDTGATGAKGPIGDTGPSGPTGDQGPTGNTGVAGPSGPSGPSGPDGTTGARYGHPIAVSTPIDSPGNNPDLAIGVDGYPVLAYQNYADLELMLMRCANVACTNTSAPVELDTVGSAGFSPSIAIGNNGSPVVVSRRIGASALDDELLFVRCANPSCTTWDPPRFVGSTSAIEAVTVTIGADGNPFIVYVEYLPNELWVIHCSDPACLGYDTKRRIDDITTVGGELDVTIGIDGHPIVAYFDFDAQDLRIVHCSGYTCAASEPARVLDFAGSVGFRPSIAIGVDGYPVIAYDDYTNGDLKVVHCTNTVCTTSDTPRTVDSNGDQGAWPSIAIGPNGNPLITATEDILLPGGNTEASLRFVECLDPSCSTAAPSRYIHRGGYVTSSGSSAIGANGALVVAYSDARLDGDQDDAIRVAVVTGSSLTKNGWGD